MTLENLVKINQLNSEPPDKNEFQCLVHTTNLNKTQIRIFSRCHDKRNLAEYEGHYETDEQLLAELIMNTKTLLECVNGITL